MGRKAPSKTPIDHDQSVVAEDRSAPILNWIKKDIQALTSESSLALEGGVTVNLSKDILSHIKDLRWTKNREKGSAYVIFIQRLLNARLGIDLALDSQLGPATNSALRQFQEKVKREIGAPYSARVIVDGIIGPATINALLSDDGHYNELKAYFNSRPDDAATTPARADSSVTPTPPVVNTDSSRAPDTATPTRDATTPADNPPAAVTGTTPREPRQAAQSFQEVLREFNTGELRLTPAQFNSFIGLLKGDSLRYSFFKLDRITQITISGSGDIETAYNGTPDNPFYYLFFRMANGGKLFKGLQRIDVHGSVESLPAFSSQTLEHPVDIHFHDVADTTNRENIKSALPTNANVHFHSVISTIESSDSYDSLNDALGNLDDGHLVLSNSQINDFITYATGRSTSDKERIRNLIREIEISDDNNTFANQRVDSGTVHPFYTLLMIKGLIPNLRKITLNTPINSYAELGIAADVSSGHFLRGIELVIPNPSDALKGEEIPKLGGMTVTLGD